MSRPAARTPGTDASHDRHAAFPSQAEHSRTNGIPAAPDLAKTRRDDDLSAAAGTLLWTAKLRDIIRAERFIKPTRRAPEVDGATVFRVPILD